MIQIENTIISDDIIDKQFVCNLIKCKGACCEAGDLGAPVEEHEIGILEDNYEKIKPYLSSEGIACIEQQGLVIHDFEGDFSTPTIDNKACAYAINDQHGILKCGIEQAYIDGAIEFKKPISCHLYPIRITKYKDYDAVNYHQWDICKPACDHGKSLGVPVYKFLKDPLIRKYGMEWYEALLAYVAYNSK
jgi:hypothetical protein